MNFQLVKTVLDDLYGEIYRANRDSADTVIQSKLDYLSVKYGDLERSDLGDVDYNDPATRFAYVYRYTTAHADIVFQCIRDMPILREALSKETSTIACLGGGPGSDVLGILKFMDGDRAPEELNKLICVICDKEQSWGRTWFNVDKKIESCKSFSTSFHFLPVDITDSASLDTARMVTDSDLFTMIYFLSEVFTSREDARDFFECLFGEAKPGALFLFVDNSRQSFYGWFDSVCRDNGMELIEHEDYLEFQTGPDEEKEQLGEYFGKFSFPKLKAKIAYRVYRKLGGLDAPEESDGLEDLTDEDFTF